MCYKEEHKKKDFRRDMAFRQTYQERILELVGEGSGKMK
jgi:hypothetical protein